LTLSIPDDGYSRNQSFDFERTWWWLFQKPIFWLWAYLMMVIPETNFLTLSIPDDGYSRNQFFDFERTWWWLFQKRMVSTKL
jgi:hypothetical protein